MQKRYMFKENHEIQGAKFLLPLQKDSFKTIIFSFGEYDILHITVAETSQALKL
jgi:hypothetical protein